MNFNKNDLIYRDRVFINNIIKIYIKNKKKNCDNNVMKSN